MNTLQEWVNLVCRELDLGDAVSPAAMQSRVLDLSRDVAHGGARPAAPLTAYLLGLAAGRSNDPEATADELAQRICLLAQRWRDDQREFSRSDEGS
ncbi:MAG: DUF6457 domain-containing protein [Actinomycetota bacterium]|nr:DUF6457 domain-containing protein [Actinomycetota bacterium]